MGPTRSLSGVSGGLLGRNLGQCFRQKYSVAALSLSLPSEFMGWWMVALGRSGQPKLSPCRLS